MQKSRFACPSWTLNLSRVLRRRQDVLWAMLVAALVAHGALSRVGRARTLRQTAKPLTTQFVKRQPRLTKPLEMRKRPRPKRRRIQREMVAVKARLARHPGSVPVSPGGVARSLSRPTVQVGRLVGLEAVEMEPLALAEEIVGTRQEKHVVQMSLEMVDIEALDTGRYHALVIQDPTDKRQVRGFFHLLLARPHALSVFGGRGSGASVWDDMKIAITRIADGMNRYTAIRTDVTGQITFDDAELFSVPWVLTPIPNPYVRLTPSEARNMGRYLMSGGFQFLDNAWGLPAPGNGGGYERATREVARETMESIGLIQGKQWEYERLPETHAIYHCYFDFSMPPPGKDMNMIQYGGLGRVVHPYLEGVSLEGRLWILFSQKGYSIGIHDFWPGGPYEMKGGDPMRIIQFGVNTIVFALTQKGSITHRLLDEVSY